MSLSCSPILYAGAIPLFSSSTLAISWYMDLMLPSTSSHVLQTPSLKID